MSAVARRRMRARQLQAVCAFVVAAAALLYGSATALGAVTWQMSSISNTTVAPGGSLEYKLTIRNVGDAPTDGSDVAFTATLPAGLTPASVATDMGVTCSIAAQTVTCTGPASFGVRQSQFLQIIADADLAATGVLTALFDITGGGAPVDDHTADPVVISAVDPSFGIDAFDAMALDENGNAYTQAAGRPFLLTTSLDFNTHTHPLIGPRIPVEDVKDVTVDLPPGLVGGVVGVDVCTTQELSNGGDPTTARPLCPVTSQVGVMRLRTDFADSGAIPVYNMVPPPGVPARFGVNAVGDIVVLDASVAGSGGQTHLRVRASNIPQGIVIDGNTFNFWGVPADESHTLERACRGEALPMSGGPVCSSPGSRKTLFRNPTSCTGTTGLVTTVTVASWLHPGDLKQATTTSHEAPGYPWTPPDWGDEHGTDGCEQVPFDPELDSQPLAGAKAGAPTAFAFDLEIPQSDSGIAQSDLKKAVVTLPEGVRVSPSSADGLGACSSAQIALGTSSEPTCPDNSKVGTVTIDTPLLDVPVTGNVYLATPFDNPFDSLVAVYIVASAKGVVIKLPGQVSMDPNTGQITTTFDDNPQLPFSRLHVEFRGGARAPLTTPNRCGTYVTHAVLTGWNGRTVTSDSSFTLAQNAKGRACPPEFTPGFSAGTESNSAGKPTSFLLRFTRSDEDQQFRDLTVKLPRGLTGKIANADLCGDAQARTDSCPAGAKIGDVTVGAGAGVNPFFITNGRAYLTGPYNGAPFGVAIVVPAIAGPFDLGKVTVRSALFVDEKTAQVSIVSDPFPTILQGIPLDVRDVRVNVNKADFFLNPTSCAEKTIAGTLTSTQGMRAAVSERFQAAECASLRLRPRMRIRVGGRGHTRRGRTTPFRTTLRMPQRNQTNLRFVRVTLPRTINARLTVINDACTRAEFESDRAKCAHAKAGTARASTPLLRDPLKGNVYFVRNGNPIPDLFVALRG